MPALRAGSHPHPCPVGRELGVGPGWAPQGDRALVSGELPPAPRGGLLFGQCQSSTSAFSSTSCRSPGARRAISPGSCLAQGLLAVTGRAQLHSCSSALSHTRLLSHSRVKLRGRRAAWRSDTASGSSMPTPLCEVLSTQALAGAGQGAESHPLSRCRRGLGPGACSARGRVSSANCAASLVPGMGPPQDPAAPSPTSPPHSLGVVVLRKVLAWLAAL